MGGTLLNAIAILVGSTLGIVIGDRLAARFRETVVVGLGLVIIVIGIDNAQASGNVIIPLLSIVGGAFIGEAIRLDLALDRLGGWLQSKFGSKQDADAPQSARANELQLGDAPSSMDARTRFITGFVTVSLIFCIGPLAIMGPIQDGMGLAVGYQQLVVKSVIDGITSLAFAATFGVGVAFTAATVFVVQGIVAVIGMVAGQFMTAPMIAEMTATGGILLLGLSIVVLDLKRPRIANLLPALLVAPLIVAVGTALGIDLYPFS